MTLKLELALPFLVVVLVAEPGAAVELLVTELSLLFTIIGLLQFSVSQQLGEV